ncbi:succinylglutamate desuccinylase [Shewanella xiamenensis]|uniref:succinylglutamate desuccinylase/aspartoacylase family protein n=1 Tax=Shewanella xiamenensis TaxID=332186 RepID=UPI001184C564|nr:succinylglutamate desuccinylase/aspartoacylase family protein [Shewanella xiamenensis]TVL23775.1 succinylglutamate desuccinylase [Shewanella xiamenensis]TVL24340.1 succinylglutamate desuccinylase [Shewanella xiamenensis]TVL26892.1 succinylglutamate desuccinylase [Shewanella xiamenensis]TVL37634.1 succinylglutamate desuccinylase [Shewanella xiamenensis]TVP05307.1 succinylglutamate desuccinylase [Shewanella xiamenensis]
MLPTTSSLQIGELAAGQALTLPIYHFKPSGHVSGPKVYIQANVHGAEVQGNAVIYQLMKQLENCHILGEITLVPLANPLGINQKSGEFTLGRFDPITGVNWNREYLNHAIDLPAWYSEHAELSDSELIQAYRSTLIEACQQRLRNDWGVTTGHRLAVSLQAMAHAADIVLDLHTGPKSCKHLYCPEYDIAAAQFFTIPYTLVIPNSFGGAMDEAAFCPWWQLSEVAKAQGRDLNIAVSAFTLELASQERICLEDALVDAKGILAYLSHRGVIAEQLEPVKMPRFGCYLKDYKKYHAPMAGLVEYVAPVGEPLAAGETLVNLLRLDLYGSEQELTALSLPQDCVPILHFASASVHQGTELYKVMTNLFELPY